MARTASGANVRVAVAGLPGGEERLPHSGELSATHLSDGRQAARRLPRARSDRPRHRHAYADGDTKGLVYDTREVAGSDQNYVFGGFQAKHREFVDCLKSGRQPGSSFSDALKTMGVAEKILASAMLRSD